MINEMKNIPIIGCAVFIVIIIIGLCFYKTKEGIMLPPEVQHPNIGDFWNEWAKHFMVHPPRDLKPQRDLYPQRDPHPQQLQIFPYILIPRLFRK